ncbi:hypothetical protein [Bradyrhizobium sp. F1.13.3]|uniref:hypothetical protein n=1 Tax=Bradyrhizobium sp. F1.13.3 TaxID=3156351 RepID=UPI003392DA0A
MSDFNQELASSTSCAHCSAEVPLVSETCPKCSTPVPPRINFHEFFAELERRTIMDARFGGLVLGREGPEDDIPLLQHQGAGVFVLIGAMQGGEYILSEEATKRHEARLHEINAEKGSLPKVSYTPGSTVIDTNLMPSGGALWVAHHGQFIVNRFATAKYFDELEKMNVSRSLSNCTK